ncbi:MAG: RNA polymerase sigma factor [Verrucomicrobiales bacterium]|nr:RNA polymerase sigma factor [Verrucomicrobiales bacterium]
MSSPVLPLGGGAMSHCGFKRSKLEVYRSDLKRLLRCTENRAFDTDDVVQETFFRAIRGCHSYNPNLRMLPWLWGIARHVIADWLKKPSVTLDVEPADQAISGLDAGRIPQGVRNLVDEFRENCEAEIKAKGLEPNAARALKLRRQEGFAAVLMARYPELFRITAPCQKLFAKLVSGGLIPARRVSPGDHHRDFPGEHPADKECRDDIIAALSVALDEPFPDASIECLVGSCFSNPKAWFLEADSGEPFGLPFKMALRDRWRRNNGPSYSLPNRDSYAPDAKVLLCERSELARDDESSSKPLKQDFLILTCLPNIYGPGLLYDAGGLHRFGTLAFGWFLRRPDLIKWLAALLRKARDCGFAGTASQFDEFGSLRGFAPVFFQAVLEVKVENRNGVSTASIPPRGFREFKPLPFRASYDAALRLREHCS